MVLFTYIWGSSFEGKCRVFTPYIEHLGFRMFRIIQDEKKNTYIYSYAYTSCLSLKICIYIPKPEVSFLLNHH